MNFAVELSNLSVTVGKKSLLNEVTLSIVEGDFVAIVGPNGAGKTSLLRAIMGANLPSMGSSLVGGIEVSTLTPHKRADVIGWVPQRGGIDEPISALEYVSTSRFRKRESQAKSEEVAMEALKRLEVDQLASRSVSSLSGGELQRLAVACALAQDTPIVLADEPGNHLDPAHKIGVMALLGELWRSGTTVVVVTHDLNELRHIGGHDMRRIRVVGLHEGSVQFESAFTDQSLPGALSQLFDVVFDTTTLNGLPYFMLSTRAL